MECLPDRFVPPRVRLTLATLAAVTALAGVASLPANAAAGTATDLAPGPSILGWSGTDEPVLPASVARAIASASPTTASARVDRAIRVGAIAEGPTDALRGPNAAATMGAATTAASLAGDRGTALPGEAIVAPSDRAAASPVEPGEGRAGDVGSPHARVEALPDPGSLQVFGLGLVIIATVAGTRRRRNDMSF